MSTETLQTLVDQYRYQVEALQKENARLNDALEKTTNLLKEILEDMKNKLKN
jgi:prefoldin subunit 5